MPEPPATLPWWVGLSGQEEGGGGGGGPQLLPKDPFLKLPQHKTSQVIVFLDINIDSRWC